VTKQYLVLPEWLQPGVAYWICEHSNGPKPNRCPHCDFTDADRGRALEVRPSDEPPVIQCAECGKTPDIDVVVHWQHDCTRDAETSTESTAQFRYETICGTCGQEHHLGTYYNHNFVARVSLNRGAGT